MSIRPRQVLSGLSLLGWIFTPEPVMAARLFAGTIFMGPGQKFGIIPRPGCFLTAGRSSMSGSSASWEGSLISPPGLKPALSGPFSLSVPVSRSDNVFRVQGGVLCGFLCKVPSLFSHLVQKYGKRCIFVFWPRRGRELLIDKAYARDKESRRSDFRRRRSWNERLHKGRHQGGYIQ